MTNVGFSRDSILLDWRSSDVFMESRYVKSDVFLSLSLEVTQVTEEKSFLSAFLIFVTTKRRRVTVLFRAPLASVWFYRAQSDSTKITWNIYHLLQRVIPGNHIYMLKTEYLIGWFINRVKSTRFLFFFLVFIQYIYTLWRLELCIAV